MRYFMKYIWAKTKLLKTYNFLLVTAAFKYLCKSLSFFSYKTWRKQHVSSTGNLRLQEMMGVMCKERGAKLFATDER